LQLKNKLVEESPACLPAAMRNDRAPDCLVMWARKYALPDQQFQTDLSNSETLPDRNQAYF
jgi:hypothetical protein|tara:strand:- start:188 stop:370 length:183 start_codon:yes stop_codon:yes gene_type:complete